MRGRFTYTHEVFLDLASKGIQIVEVPVRVRGTREYGTSKVAPDVWRYGLRTGSIVLSFYRDTQPFFLCLWAAMPLWVLGLIALGVSYQQLLRTDRWLKWAGFLGGGLVALALTLVLLGFVLDIVRRIRENQEETLYWLRRLATSRSGAARYREEEPDNAA